MKGKHSLGILAIVIYKGLAAILLAITAIGLLFISFKRQWLLELSESYMLEEKLQFLEWIVNKITNTQPKTLELTGIATSLYAIVTGIEAVGLWYEKPWAELLVIGLVGLGIPIELYELFREASLIKLAILLINLAILLYLIYYYRKSQALRLLEMESLNTSQSKGLDTRVEG